MVYYVNEIKDVLAINERDEVEGLLKYLMINPGIPNIIVSMELS